jgi:hypothetical protein
MLVGAVIDDQFDDHANVMGMRLFDEIAEVAQRPVGGIDRFLIRDVVAVVAQRRLVKRQQPDRIGSQRTYVIQPLRQSAEVADAIIVGIRKGSDVKLVNYRIFVPGVEMTVDRSGR